MGPGYYIGVGRYLMAPQQGSSPVNAVTLRWEDPADAAEFRLIRDQYRRDGYLTGPASEALLELLGSSEVAEDDGSDERRGQ